MASEITGSKSILTFALMLFSVAMGNLNQSSDTASSPESLIHAVELPVAVNVVSNIGRPSVLLYNMESEVLIRIQYSLNCSSYETVYSIFAATSAQNIAVITGSPVFNISCAKANFMNSSWDYKEDNKFYEKEDEKQSESHVDAPVVLGIVEGEANLTLKTLVIGRSFLIFLAQKINDLDQFKTGNFTSEHSDSSSHDDLHLTLKTPNAVVNKNNSHSVSMVTETKQRDEDLNLHQLPQNVVGKAMIIVMQLPRITDEIFRIVLYVVIVLATVGMGVKVEFEVIKNVLRRPTGPIIGLCCQYICMPLIAYIVAKAVPQESAAVSLGIFACGIVPGGGVSNMFSFLLGADLSLSVTMTTLSSVAGLGLLPLWLFTLGDTFNDDMVEMHVPYEKILEALAVAILPLFVGMFIKYKVPRVAELISKILKPVLVIIVAFSISFGVYINFYIFKMIRPMTIFAGCLLPYIGYLVGGFIAFLSFRTWTHIKTIAIETGIQNTVIAFLILFLSLPPPDNQLAAVAPASSAVMTPLPLFVAVILYTIYQRYTNKKKVKKTKDLENGNVQNKMSQVDDDISKQKEETALIVLLWHKLSGHHENRNLPDGILSIKELDTMLPEKKNLST